MYATCLFCSGALGRNERVEHFPVGRRLAYDAERGRLWAVCPRCARWNLSPLEERWEAIEECERLFSVATRRVATENIALAKLPEGLTLVRIGRPKRPEFAAWRYGAQIERRRRQTMWTVGLGLGAFGAVVAGGVAAGVVAGPMFWLIQRVGGRIVRGSPGTLIARIHSPTGVAAVRRHHLAHVRLGPHGDGGWALSVPSERGVVELVGERALGAAARLLPGINRFAGTREDIDRAVSFLGEDPDPMHAYLRLAGRRDRAGSPWTGASAGAGHALTNLPDAMRLALEMAAHEEQERRAGGRARGARGGLARGRGDRQDRRRYVPPAVDHRPHRSLAPLSGDDPRHTRMPIFQKPHFTYDCDRCGARFDPRKGGVCSVCKDMLCGRDLYGSVVEQLKVYFGAPMVCTRCRAERQAAATGTGRAS